LGIPLLQAQLALDVLYDAIDVFCSAIELGQACDQNEKSRRNPHIKCEFTSAYFAARPLLKRRFSFAEIYALPSLPKGFYSIETILVQNK
jgi:hypothetical protein